MKMKFCLSPSFVTPAKAGVHYLRLKFTARVMDSRLRGNDEVLAG
jgi:hypothetical protein